MSVVRCAHLSNKCTDIREQYWYKTWKFHFNQPFAFTIGGENHPVTSYIVSAYANGLFGEFVRNTLKCHSKLEGELATHISLPKGGM